MPSLVARRYEVGCWLVVEADGEVDLSTRSSLTGSHGAVRVAGPSPQARKLLALTALDQHVGVFDSLDEAVSGHASCR